MKQRRRIYYTDGQKALMWERWRKGESLQQIAQLFDRNHSSVQRILAETGGGFIRSMQHTRRKISRELWVALEPLIPVFMPSPKGGRRRTVDDRAALSGVLYVLQTGNP